MSRARTALAALVSLAVSGLALVLAFWQVRWQGGLALTARVHGAELKAALAGVDGGWLAAFSVLNVTTLLWRGVQLRATARRRDGSAPRWLACYDAVSVGMMAQNLLPARLSEPVRVVALVKGGDVAPATATGAVVLGRALDLVALLLVTCLPSAALSLPAMGRALRTTALVGSLAAALLIVGLLLLYRGRAATTAWAARVRPWLGRATAGFTDGLSALGAPRRLGEAALASLATPVTLAAAYGCALAAFGLDTLPTGSTLILIAAVLFAIAIPSAPSSVGVFHAVASWVLRSLGATAAAAAAFALVVHAIGVVSFVALGALSLVHVGGRDLLRGWRKQRAPLGDR